MGISNSNQSNFLITAEVDLRNENNGSPVSSLPVIVEMVQGGVNNIQIPVADPQGHPFTCRLGTNSEAGGGTYSTPNAGVALTISPSCLMTWDTTGTVINQLWMVHMSIEETNNDTRVELDFFIQIIDGSLNQPPTCVNNGAANNIVTSGTAFQITLTGTDPDGGNITVSHGGLPAGATLVPLSGASPYTTTFNWTPAVVDEGTVTVVTVFFKDDANATTFCSFTVTVPDALADLSVTKVAFPEPVAIGTGIAYTVVVTNSGPQTAVSATVSDVLSPDVTLLTVSTTQGTCTVAINCSLGDIASGSSATITITVLTLPAAGATVTNSVSVASNVLDPITSDNSASVISTIVHNQAPTCDDITIVIAEDSGTSSHPLKVQCNDPDGDSIDIEIVALSLVSVSPVNVGTLSFALPSLGAIELSPDLNFYGSGGTFGFIARDSDGAASLPALGTVTVTPVNDPPVITGITDDEIDENETASIDVTFSDADPGDTHTVDINWGPGQTPDLGVPVSTGTTTFTHQYLDDGTSPGNVTTFDVNNVVVTVYDATISPPGAEWEYTFIDPTGVASWNTTTCGWATGNAVFGACCSGGPFNTIATPWAADPADVILNIDAQTDGLGNEQSVNVPPGSYELTVVGSAVVGADYDAWSAWTLPGPWVSQYSYTTPTTGTINVGNLTQYASPALALANAPGVQIVEMPNGGTISIWNGDATNSGGDNSGGMSILVSKVDGDDLWVRRTIDLTGVDLSQVSWGLGVDNGFKLYANGTLIDAQNAGGGTHRWEYTGGFGGALVSGVNVIAVALEDHGGATAFDMEINASPFDIDVNASGNCAGSVTVNNVAPVVSVPTAPAAIDEAQTASIIAVFTDVGSLDSHTATIDWGDGSGVIGLGTVTSPISASHPYGDDGLYTVTIIVTDDDSGVGQVTAQVTVNNVAPTITSAEQVGSIPEGTAFVPNPVFGNIVVQSTDPTESNDPPVYTFDCDGVIPLDYETPAIAGTSTANCLFDDNGNYTVSVRVDDGDGGSDTADVAVTVTNVAPTASLGNGGPVNEGSTDSVNFSNIKDPSTADTAVLRYSYDFDNDGSFDLGDGTYAGGVSSTLVTIPAIYFADGPGSRIVNGRIMDDDGGSNDYLTTIQINNVPPIVTANGD